ncbi:RNA polymerase sigma factor [Glutamicibacter endophyticus]
MTSPETVRRVLAGIDRDSRARILATLARRFGDLDLAEDATQDAFAQAITSWPHTGVPESPEAWLKTAAKRKALDVVRRESVLAQKLARLRIEQERAPAPDRLGDPADATAVQAVPDERLALFFACAHPAMSIEDRVALTLRFVAGLTTAEVAHALLVPVTTMQQRIVRAKKRIRTLGVPLEVPPREQLPARLAEVQRVVYLLYAEGFARSAGEAHVRDDLTTEAIRLARVLRALVGGEACVQAASSELTGLLALLLLTEARRPARVNGSEGQPVPLAAQDRQLWNREFIVEGLALAEAAAEAPGAGPYAIQAAIAAVHAEAESFAQTDWKQIAVLYGLLEAHEPGPVVRLGRAVALGRAHGPAVGRRLLDALAGDPALARFRPFHIARAVTLEELADYSGAAAAYRLALAIPGNEAEDGYLAAALDGILGELRG